MVPQVVTSIIADIKWQSFLMAGHDVIVPKIIEIGDI